MCVLHVYGRYQCMQMFMDIRIKLNEIGGIEKNQRKAISKKEETEAR